ncbi:hypothetical protein GKZ68_18050 [Hymenobacter sp. BRD128]|uniref:hypothetical protein n=1 Tax=Hymenobacter sp. BRD128 TaxID=2675878 RepID=UPI0015671E25|nr:hypothetical protein [Hymenobacter sp. BRD128]QKG58364.1 hypothetical protein GKZ68_18050 [Hymenobacter sp. BRD128]
MLFQRKMLGGPVALAALALLGSCSTTQQAETTTSPADRPSAIGAPRAASTVSGQAQSKGGITLTPYNDSPKFPSAQMRLNAPIQGSTVPSGEVTFSYELTNFQLTKMTDSDHAMQMANSMKGQHIHNIVDNMPYTAHYDTKFTKPIPDGQHVVLSFLSRSYHESLKHMGAYDLRTITVGTPAAGTPPMAFDLKAPHLFYSRPKDTYSGKDAQKIMLDFYLVNTTLAPDGNKVRATINGTEFMLDQWLPYMMEGLPAGQATIKLELLDSSGNLIPGPYNSVTRTITVAP